jgi:hypothetical protein
VHGLLRAVWLVAAAAVVGVAFAAIVVILRGQPGEDDFKTVASLFAVSLCGGAAIAALHLLQRAGLRLLGAAVLVAAGVELVLLELGIWKGVFFDGHSSSYVKLVPTGFAWGIATFVLATLPLVASSRRLLLTLVPAVGACALVGATIATMMIWRDLESGGWTKTLAVLAILMVAGYLLSAIAQQALRERAREA